MSTSKQNPADLILSPDDIQNGPVFAVCHPLSRESSEVHLRPLGSRVGLQRTQVQLGRIPKGKESFVFHRHLGDEEWVYILSGNGQMRIGEERFAVAAGSFVGFPTPSLPHCLINTGEEDLVYLMGGERGRVEITEFPDANTYGFFSPDGILMVDSAHVRRMSIEDYRKKG